jgi:hypothetical protein
LPSSTTGCGTPSRASSAGIDAGSTGLVAADWVVLHVTAADLRDPEILLTRIRDLLAVRESGEPGV